jgi:uncharacterized protein (DUF2235 family)
MNNIAIFIDGTDNDGERDTPRGKASNVYKLYRSCNDPDPLYLRGVGSRRGDALGGLVGFGTKKRLKLSYRHLIENYQQGDSIYLFGFSRGAFAARLFAGFLGYVGTLFGHPPFEHYLPHMYRIYESSVVLNVVDRFERYLGLLSEKRPDPLPIHFIGVWDTVERYLPVRDLPEITTLPSHITHARHALAIHERRNEMSPTLWTEWQNTSTMKQVWFPGAHSDVGGGHVHSKLSQAPLDWMHGEASIAGLKLSGTPDIEQERILHQDRTDIPWSGKILPRSEGEDIREALRTTQRRVMESMEVDPTVREHLFDRPIPEGNYRFSSHFNAADQKAARIELHKVDDEARNLINRLR